MNNNDLTAVKKTASKTQKYKIIIKIIIVLVIITNILAVLGINSQIFVLLTMVLPTTLFILVILNNKAVSKYSDAVVNDIINPVIRERFPDIKYFHDVPSGSVNSILKKYRNAKMFNSDSDEVMQNHIISDVNNLEIVSLKTSHTTKDSNNHSHTVVSFTGTLVSFDTEVNIPDDCAVKVTCSTKGFVKEKTFIPFTFNGNYINQHTIDVGNPDFDECFQVCADSEHSAMYVLNPYVVEKLINLRKLYNEYSIYISKHKILVSLDEYDAFISIPNSSTKFDDTIFDKFGERLQYMIDFLNDVTYSISSSTKVNDIF